jgi:hypothetical protein
MKVTIDIECTPEEARRAIGLPDLTPLHDAYLSRLMQAMDGRVQPEAVEALLKSWMPMSDAGMGLWRQMFDQGAAKRGG